MPNILPWVEWDWKPLTTAAVSQLQETLPSLGTAPAAMAKGDAKAFVVRDDTLWVKWLDGPWKGEMTDFKVRR